VQHSSEQLFSNRTDMEGRKLSMGIIGSHLQAAAIVVVVMVMALMTDAASTSKVSPLTVGFYATSCPSAESLIQRATQAKFNVDKTITAGLLRIFFHDCFVQVLRLQQQLHLLWHCHSRV